MKYLALFFLSLSTLAPNLAHSEDNYETLYRPDVPFCSEAKKFNINNAYWLALASNVAYEKQARINGFINNGGVEENINKIKIEITHVGEYSDLSNGVIGVSTDILFVESNTDLVIAVRGTDPDDAADIISDLSAQTINWDWAGKVHVGFYNYFQSLWPAIETKLKSVENKNVWITGHSLGAAGATLLHVYLARQQADGNFTNFKLRPLYTFGSPRVGDDLFAQAINNDISIPPIYRLRNWRDAITMVPKMSRSNIKTYRHVGQFIYIEKRGELNTEADEHKIGKNLRDIPFMNFFKSLKSHLLTTYITRLISHIPEEPVCPTGRNI